jgi:hypothetical protein
VLDGLHEALFAALSEQRITSAVAESAARLGVDMQERLVAMFLSEGKLTSGDVRDVRQVELGEAVSELPFSVFEPATSGAIAWRAIVRADLERALAAVPEAGCVHPGAREVARAIRKALELLEREPVEAALAVDAA